MAGTDIALDYLEALLADDNDRLAELHALLDEHVTAHELVEVTTAALRVAVARRFTAGTHPSAITEFVLETKDIVGMGDDEFVPLLVEAAIRSALGEKHMLDGIDLAPTVPAQVVVVARILADDELSAAEIDEFRVSVSRLIRSAEA